MAPLVTHFASAALHAEMRPRIQEALGRAAARSAACEGEALRAKAKRAEPQARSRVDPKPRQAFALSRLRCCHISGLDYVVSA